MRNDAGLRPLECYAHLGEHAEPPAQSPLRRWAKLKSAKQPRSPTLATGEFFAHSPILTIRDFWQTLGTMAVSVTDVMETH